MATFMGLPNSLVANLDCTGMAAIGATCGCFAAPYWIREATIGCKSTAKAAADFHRSHFGRKSKATFTLETQRTWRRIRQKAQATTIGTDQANGGDVPVRPSSLFLVDVLLEFHAGGELGDFAGGDLDDASRLRIAS